jgi:hypothetical protein
VNLPKTALEGCCGLSQYDILVVFMVYLTLFRALKSDKELLPARYVSNLCKVGSKAENWVRTLQHKLAMQVCETWLDTIILLSLTRVTS